VDTSAVSKFDLIILIGSFFIVCLAAAIRKIGSLFDENDEDL
jgi:hypothetical protein